MKSTNNNIICNIKDIKVYENWTKENIEKFNKSLNKLIDKNYLVFNKKIITTKYEMLGIRVPIIRRLAKKIKQTDIKSYLNNNKLSTYEEILLFGIVISYLKDLEEFEYYFNIFINYIDNWAICDIALSSMTIISINKDYFLEKIKLYLNSENEFIVRVGIVLLLYFYIEDKYIDEILKLIDNIDCNKYYVNMAISWLISEMYINNKNKITTYLKNDKLDTFTHNKAIQKIKESRRVSKQEKELINNLKH